MKSFLKYCIIESTSTLMNAVLVTGLFIYIVLQTIFLIRPCRGVDQLKALSLRDVSFDQTRAAMSIRPCGAIGDTDWAYEVSSL